MFLLEDGRGSVFERNFITGPWVDHGAMSKYLDTSKTQRNAIVEYAYQHVEYASFLDPVEDARWKQIGHI